MTQLRNQWLAVQDRLTLVPLPTGTMLEYAERFHDLLTTLPLDVAFLAMAASDYAPEPNRGKLPSTADELVIRCHRLPKLIATARDLAPSLYLVGFKLTSNVSPAETIRQATAANLANRADLTVANDLSTVRQGQHTIHLVRPGYVTETLAPPDSIADRLVERVLAWAQTARTAPAPTRLPGDPGIRSFPE